MNKILSTFVIFFLLSLPLNAEIAKDVIINGNDRISNETVKVYGGIKLNKDYSENEINDILKNLYETGFFENEKRNKKSNQFKREKTIN